MPLSTEYVSKTAGPDGRFTYTSEETAVWRDLFDRQMRHLPQFACADFLSGLERLGLSRDTVPQVVDVDARLRRLNNAGVVAVDALIPQDEFSGLLQARKFPVATFIRKREHFDYIEEPDIFHECFGHCPMMTNDAFCQFLERFGTLSLSLDAARVERLFRLFWFTVEFGLIREGDEIRAFGAGILSSPGELAAAFSGEPDILDFDLMTVLRTPYRIDIVQPVYFLIERFEDLAKSIEGDVRSALDRAAALGDLPARFDAVAS